MLRASVEPLHVEKLSVLENSMASSAYHDSREEHVFEEVECIAHSELKLEFVCRKCTTPICKTCLFQHHNGHKLAALSQYAQKLQRAKSYISSLQGKVREEMREVESRRAEEEKEVQLQFERLFSNLREKKREILG